MVLEEGDSQALAFADESFDRVSMAFAIRNVPNRSRALAEIARVLRAGGRVCTYKLDRFKEENWSRKNW